MNLVVKPLEQASPAQRLHYARTILNADLDGRESDEQVISLIRSAQPGNPNIFVEDEPTPEVFDMLAGAVDAPTLTAEQVIAEDLGRTAGGLGRGDPRATIRIPNVDSADGLGNHDVPVGINGIVWQLKRGMDLDVPWRVVEALGLTESDVVRHDDQGEVIISKSRRVPVEIINRPSAAEIDAWHKATDTRFCP